MSMTCPTCNIALVAESGPTRKAQCPKCGFSVNYVAVESVPAKNVVAERQEKQTEVGTGEQSAEKTESAKTIEIPKHTTVVCPTCGTRIHPSVRKKERTVKCPDCYVRVRVPPLDEVMKTLAEKARTLPLEDVGQYEFQAPVVSRPSPVTTVSTTYSDVQAEIYQEALPPPPRWTFISGVFTFPWRRDSVVRWVGLSFCAFILVFILIVSILPFVMSGGQTGGFGGAIILVCMGVLVALLGLWTVSYAAAALLAVITDTAAGNDRVTAWPEFQFIEWLNSLIHVAYAATVTMLLAWIITLAVALATDSTTVAVLLTMHFGFPVVLLSTLEADSRWMPLTEPIVVSLGKFWLGWLQFYVLSAAVFALLIACDIGFLMALPIIRPLFLGPAIAAALLIYARLLGRLAWLASTPDASTGKKSKRKKKRKTKKRSARSQAE